MKRRGKLAKGVLFHQDNVPVHKCVAAMAPIHGCGFNLIEHPLYSPDLAPSDFHLSQKTESSYFWHYFQTDDDVILVVDGFLGN